MLLFLSLGFELDLYTPREMPTILWYMDYIYGRYLHNHSIITTAVKAAKKKGGKKKNVVKKKEGGKPEKLPPNILLLEIQQYLVRGILRLICAVHLERNLIYPDFPFGSVELRFCHRFGPFFQLPQPPSLHHSHLDQFMNQIHSRKFDEIYSLSKQCFKTAQTSVEKILQKTTNPPPVSILEEAKSLMKVAVSNTLQITLLEVDKARVQKISSPSFEMNMHPWLCTVKII